MATKKWADLSPRARRAITLSAAVETTLKVVALADLARRPADEVNGSKAGWATALTLVSSVGVLPACYLIRGRKRA